MTARKPRTEPSAPASRIVPESRRRTEPRVASLSDAGITRHVPKRGSFAERLAPITGLTKPRAGY